MCKHRYAKYSLKDFTSFDCLKLSKLIYMMLAFVTRGYLIWIMSISNMNNQTDTIKMAFPDPKMFYLSLLSGALGLFVILIISLRRPQAPLWVRRSWQHIRKFILLALLVDLAVSLVGYFLLSVLSPFWLIVQLLITLLFIILLYTHNKIKLNIKEFPETVKS